MLNVEDEGESSFKDTLPEGARPRVLLIDDDEDFLELTAAVLALEGMEVMIATNPTAALAEVRREPPDVILLDMLLGGIDGLDVLEALRAEPGSRSVPVLACTALGTREAARMLPSLGFAALLSKPVAPGELVRAVRRHVAPRTAS